MKKGGLVLKFFLTSTIFHSCSFRNNVKLAILPPPLPFFVFIDIFSSQNTHKTKKGGGGGSAVGSREEIM